jgi:hypothetical protein
VDVTDDETRWDFKYCFHILAYTDNILVVDHEPKVMAKDHIIRGHKNQIWTEDLRSNSEAFFNL